MLSDRDRGRVSRRTLLRAAGASAAALAGGALLPERILAAGPALRVGVVVPRAPRSPALATGVLDGLSAALAAPGAPPVRLLPAWYEGGQRAARRQVEALVSGGADLVVAAMSRREAAGLGPLLAERRVPLLVADVGATMLRPDRVHPYIFRSSLGHWQAAWALGQWAAAGLGRRALIAADPYDGGFDAIYAFWRGFEQAGGARPALFIPGTPGGSASPLAAAAAARAELVFGLHSGPGALAFVRGYRAAGLGALPLIGPGTLTAESLLAAHGPAALGVRTAHSWAGAAPGAPADEFAALGYDAGLLVGAAAGLAGGRPALLRDALAAATVRGARGPLAFDQATLEVHPPVALREVRAAAGGSANVAVADLTPLALRPLAPPAGPRSERVDAFLML